MEQTQQLVETIKKGIQEKKGSNIVVADMKGIDGAICRYFVICQGSSPSQVEAITDSVSDMVRVEMGEKPVKVAGLDNAQWVAMDYSTCWCTYSCPTFANTMTWSICGRTLP